TPPTPPKDGFDMDAFFNRLAQSQQEAIVQATKPLQDELNAIRSEKMLATRHDSVINKVNELKLSKSWNVDFSNGIKIASLELGDKATAEEIFAKANEHFNATLSARGETYTPQPGDLGSSGSVDFSTTKAILQAEKERREKTN
ncbi:MAG: hypothetical protein RRY36_09640, partial [Bacteroidaceae bacterium]